MGTRGERRASREAFARRRANHSCKATAGPEFRAVSISARPERVRWAGARGGEGGSGAAVPSRRLRLPRSEPPAGQRAVPLAARAARSGGPAGKCEVHNVPRP